MHALRRAAGDPLEQARGDAAGILADDEVEHRVCRLICYGDPAFPRIFDHFDLGTVKWLLGDLVRDQQLQGASLY